MPRYPDYASLPQHIREMLVAVTRDDDSAERFANTPHKHLNGRSVMEVINVWFGRRTIERFLLDLGNYLGVDDMDRFEQHFGKKK